jgi:ribosomal-protein-alanine N-acetyltransferase
VTETPTLTIRRAALSDLDSILVIERASFPTPWSRAVMASELSHPAGCYIVAELDGRLVGYTGASCFAGEAHIMNVAVAPDSRRCGIGEALILELLRRTLELNAELAYLEYRPSNTAAAALYRKLGFRRVGRRRNYYRDTGEDAVLMTLDELPRRWSSSLSAYWETWGKRYGRPTSVE